LQSVEGGNSNIKKKKESEKEAGLQVLWSPVLFFEVHFQPRCFFLPTIGKKKHESITSQEPITDPCLADIGEDV